LFVFFNQLIDEHCGHDTAHFVLALQVLLQL